MTTKKVLWTRVSELEIRKWLNSIAYSENRVRVTELELNALQRPDFRIPKSGRPGTEIGGTHDNQPNSLSR